MQEARSTSKPADYTLDETYAIIEAGLGKNAAGVFRKNARRSEPVGKAEELTIIVRETVTAMIPAIIAAIKGALPELSVAALPAPEEKSERVHSVFTRQLPIQAAEGVRFHDLLFPSGDSLILRSPTTSNMWRFQRAKN